MPQFNLPSACKALVLGLAMGAAPGAPAAPQITEFMAANASGLRDEDGDFSDWIEIHNPDSAPVSLAGYHLTDNPANPARWTFPAVTLDPEAYLVVFASGKNRTDPAGRLHTDFRLSAGGEYLALVAPDGVTTITAFAPAYPPQFDNVSFGLGTVGLSGGATYTSDWTFFSTPTPGAANGPGTRAGPIVTPAVKDPPQPVAGALIITASVRPSNNAVAGVKLFYRTMYAAETMIEMTDDGAGSDASAGDGIWTAVIPAAAFVPGKMTRWRFVASDIQGTETREPAFRSPTDSHQYYGTVADDPSIQTLLPVFHWFTSNTNGAGTATGSRGSVYYEGEFYDNVRFDLHGQSSTGFPKKSYNIDFPRTQRFLWSSDAPRVADIDLLSNWGDKSKVRTVLSFEIMREAGVAAHFAFTVRVQQNGGFFSTADLVEDADEIYLERAGLNPAGALYKVYANGLNKDARDTATGGVEKKTRRFEKNTDLQGLIDGLDLTGTALTAYLYDNIDIPRCVNLLAANSVIRNIDMNSKNWYIYRDTGRSDEWAMLPWDLDLSHGRFWDPVNTYFDNALYTNGYVVTSTYIRLVSHLFANPATRSMIFRRIRTLTDRFLHPPAAPGTPENELYYERRLNEQLALLDPPSIAPSDARRDFEKWGSWLQRGATVSYTNTNSAVETMAKAIGRWKTEYLPGRRNYIYNSQVTGRGGEIPQPQPARPVINFGAIEFNPASGNQDQEFIQLLNPSSIAVDISDWRLTGAIEHTIAPGTVLPRNGALYVCPSAAAFRARPASPKGGEGLFVQGGSQGHLSSLGGTIILLDASGATNNTISYEGQPSDTQRYLVVSELMYHPPGDGLAEFIELLNISDMVTLDLTKVRFTQGVEFDFSGSAVTSLAPGARVLVVRDLEAFERVYGPGRPVAGVFTHQASLSNSGELVKIEDTDNGTIQEFAYEDESPWPAGIDGSGYSLVLIAPETHPDPALAANWRSSARPGGSPGGTDTVPFPADPLADGNGNGEPDLFDYALGQDLGLSRISPAVTWRSDRAGGADNLLLTYPVSLGAERAKIEVLFSTDLMGWEEAAPYLALRSEEQLGDGRALVTWRVKPPLEDEPQLFIRLRVAGQ